MRQKNINIILLRISRIDIEFGLGGIFSPEESQINTIAYSDVSYSHFDISFLHENEQNNILSIERGGFFVAQHIFRFFHLYFLQCTI